MAWRDVRRNPTRLFIFISSIILGIASLVAINSFSENLQQDIDNQAKELLGADLVLNVTQELKPETRKFLDSLGGTQAREINFASMVLFPKNNGSRLVQVRALEGNYPFYGNIETLPQNANKIFLNQQKAIVEQTLLIQFDSDKGDSVKIGNINFEIEGKITKLPGQSGITASVAPVVYIPIKYLDQTNLVQKGSRVNYRFYYKFAENFETEKLLDQIRTRLEKESITSETVESRKKTTSKTFQSLNDFLNLVSFVALLLGCVGVASAVHVYVKEKISSIAILRCLGASGSQTFAIFLIQTVFMGFVGSVVGAFLGSAIQSILPLVFADFLPLSMTLQISWNAIFSGIFIGTGISLLFSLLPLISVRQISPLRTLRLDFEENIRFDWLLLPIYLLILGFILCFSFLQIGSWFNASIFTIAILFAFLLLAGMAKLFIWLVRKYFPSSLTYVWRQGLANLYRPNNQTLILVLCIGLGTALISTLFFIQDLLISQVTLRNQGSQPNMILFDIQNPQKQAVIDLTKKMNLPILQETPIITMRLFAVNGKDREQMKKDSINKPDSDGKTKKALRVPDWAIDREYRVTYRDTLSKSSEEITEGVWRGKVNSEKDSIFVSFDGDYAKRMNVKIG
ncbi:MAG: FtsX-like permease family protein, partial [Bacteroidetes bacterium]